MRPAILPRTVLIMMEFLRKKVLKCLPVIKDVRICLLIPSNIPLVIVEVMKDIDIGLLIPSTLPPVITEVIKVVMLIEVDLGHNLPDKIPLPIVKHELMLKGELDIGLIPYTIPTITQVTVADC